MEPVIDLQVLLQPIPGENPAGADLSYSQEFDDIKEARRADDDLPQDEWERKLKVAEWPKVVNLASELLASRTKDLQLAAWLAEALTQTRSFAGLHGGLTLIRDLIEGYWDTLYPTLEDGVGMRAGKLGWLNSVLPPVIANLPLTGGGSDGLALRHWNEALEVENVARRDPGAAQRLVLEDGKTSSETFNKSVSATPNDFYASLYQQMLSCKAILEELDQTVGNKLGDEAPALSGIRRVLDDVAGLVTRIAREKGILQAECDLSAEEQAGTPGPTGMPVQAGPVASRQDALRKLSEVAQYFRVHEPHSPVAFLVDRAVRWGHMPLDQWLSEVVKDQGQLHALYDLLGVRASGE